MQLYQIRVSNGETTLISEADVRQLSDRYAERFVTIQPLNADGSAAASKFSVNPNHVIYVVEYP